MPRPEPLTPATPTMKRDTVPMIRPPRGGDSRPADQIEQHYEVEKRLAARLMAADRAERRRLYASLYDELFRLVPHHPQLTRKQSPEQQARVVDAQLAVIRRYLGPETTYMEIGAGDCAMTFRVCPLVRQAYAVDVSETITSNADVPPNFRLIISDGCSIPVPPGSVDFAYSNQLMEHLHPDDAREQLENIWTALAPGGRYFCITPNRIQGPHDVSYSFDTVARGFHLKEYTVAELARLFREVGFRDVRMLVGGGGRYLEWPTWPARTCEALLGMLPRRWGHALSMRSPLRAVIRLYLVGRK